MSGKSGPFNFPGGNQRGATTVEYAVIVTFIVLAVIVVVLVLQDQSQVVFNEVGNQTGQFGRIENGV